MENIKLCDYGCGKPANFCLKNSKWCCCDFPGKCEAIRKKNSEGLKRAHRSGKMKPFPKESRQNNIEAHRQNAKRKMLDYFFNNPNVFYTSEALKRNLLYADVPYKCDICGIDSWQNKQITLEVDHIDGIRNHNTLDNLRFLCPNCHSQTDTWRGRNINTGKVKVSDDELLQALKESKNIRQALIKVGLAPKGANYMKAAKLLEKNDNL